MPITRSDKQNFYLRELKRILPNNQRVRSLFDDIPKMSKDVYVKTSSLYAETMYEETLQHGVPHGFCQILEDSLNKLGVKKTLDNYKDSIALICKTMKIDIDEFTDLLIVISNNDSLKAYDRKEALLTLRSIIKKFNIKFKGEFLKNIIEEKNRLLSMTTIKIHQPNEKIELSSESFLQLVLSNSDIKKRVLAMIYDLFSINLDDNDFNGIILAIPEKNCLDKMIEVIELDKPQKYIPLKERKKSKRLKLNFEKLLNDMISNFTEEEKKELQQFIEYKANGSSTLSNVSSLDNLKTLLEHNNIVLIEQLAVLLAHSNSILVLKNGKFTFEDKISLSDDDIEACLQYENSINVLKKIELSIKSFYNSQKSLYLSFMKKTEKQLKIAETDVINRDKWLNLDMIAKIIPLIDIDKLNLMSEDAFLLLKKFLMEDGLLWAYLAGNIKEKVMAKIINNFEKIYTLSRELINIDNLAELIKKVNLYEYTSDIAIGLIGIENLEKVINYNQFSGVTITSKIILERINKIIDLAVRSENITTSSLPFNCSIKNGDYSLVRYLNNDPKIFTSGIDTKTCFFVSVNENDFFFYSLLSKDGYVLKILNNNKLVARATCFRKNNILMINGIQHLNNKTVPENKEDLQEFKDIVRLIKLMSKKMIELTTNDECPIDYVVCNKSGILENSAFEGEFEILNSDLFREPLNIYSEDWEKFVHTYDNEEEQLFQEVCFTPNHSFTTDFGDYYPPCLIEARNNMALLSPKDISYNDQRASYKRPRVLPEEYIAEEIDSNILFRINRLRALACFTGGKYQQQMKQANYTLIKDLSQIKNIILGDDWCIIFYNNGKNEIVISKDNEQKQIAEMEMAPYLDNDKADIMKKALKNGKDS